VQHSAAVVAATAVPPATAAGRVGSTWRHAHLAARDGSKSAKCLQQGLHGDCRMQSSDHEHPP
jgi:hypothetical protein